MIGLLHGYLLDGSGSNLWTRSVVRALCARGETVHLFCQESDPERYDFVAEAVVQGDGGASTLFRRETPFPGRCILHRPDIGDTLPVFVRDRYDEFERVVPVRELPDADIERYVRRNVDAIAPVVEEAGIPVLLANHAVLMPVVARRVRELTGVPYAVMPHGSALEYAVRPDERLRHMAADALRDAARVFVVGEEMEHRLLELFPGVQDLRGRLRRLPLGVDTAAFTPAEPAQRPARIRRIPPLLSPRPPGRGAAQDAALQTALRGEPEPAALAGRLAAIPEYDGKRPDEGAGERLLALDWDEARVALFVGRLIAAKGAQAVVGALPLVLRRERRARLVVVGHGPLREVLEALVRALRRGDRRLVGAIADAGATLETAVRDREAGAGGDGVRPLPELRALLDALESRGETETYYAAARALPEDAVVFTGYLRHAELCHLYPCCDAAVFPSMVAEAGPLVFLEALAAGCFPLGTDFGGMAESMDAAAGALPDDAAELMRLSPDPARVADDISRKLPAVLERHGRDRLALRQVAVRHYDWSRVADLLVGELSAASTGARRSRSASDTPSSGP